MGGKISIYDNPKWIGRKFGSLTVVETVLGKKGNGTCWFWKMKCDCGNETIVLPNKVIKGYTNSCGCKKKDRCRILTEKYRVRHGDNGTRLYHIWHGMRQRCINKNNKDYKNYGFRGIKVCDQWLNSYVDFKTWALSNGYEETLTLDRIDVNGDYCPENCRWVTVKEQCRNKRETVYLEFDGERKPLIQWADEIGIDYQTLYGRVFHKGWNVEKALTTPVMKQFSKHTV